MMLSHRRPLLLALVFVRWYHSNAYRVAIIGGGISGTFAAKYLAEYDVHHRSSSPPGADADADADGGADTIIRDCLLDEIVVYDISPPPASFAHGNYTDTVDTVDSSSKAHHSSSDPRPHNWQGSRVSSITLQDGSVVELGASII